MYCFNHFPESIHAGTYTLKNNYFQQVKGTIVHKWSISKLRSNMLYTFYWIHISVIIFSRDAVVTSRVTTGPTANYGVTHRFPSEHQSEAALKFSSTWKGGLLGKLSCGWPLVDVIYLHVVENSLAGWLLEGSKNRAGRFPHPVRLKMETG